MRFAKIPAAKRSSRFTGAGTAPSAGRILPSLVSLIAIVLPLILLSAEGRAFTESHDTLTVTDVVSIESAGDFEISPGGGWVVWVRTTADEKENERRRSIYLTSLEDTNTIRITRGSGNSYAPRFSPGGSAIAFLRKNGKEKPQICLFETSGGEPEKLTKSSTGVMSFAWRNDSEILFTAREDSTLRETKLREAKDDAVVVADEAHYMPVRLFTIDRKTKRAERVSTNQGVVTEFSVSPDGRLVVTNENQDVNYHYDQRVPPKQFLYDLEAGTRLEVFTAPYVDPYDFAWADDGEGFYCRRRIATDSTDTYVSISRLYYYSLSENELSEVPFDWERGLGRAYCTVRGGVVAALADGVRDRIAYVKRSGSRFRKTLLESPSGKSMMLSAGDSDGLRLVYTVSSASTVPNIVTAAIKGKRLAGERTIFELNGHLLKKSLARTEVIHWNGALGDRIEGILYYPREYREGERYPLVIDLHGGPGGVDRDFFSERWSEYPHLLASRGTFILKVNYHGSGNYGLAWLESIKGHYYEYEVPDILSGMDHLIAGGLIDEERIGIMGWSNGAILAIACCLESDRFNALCAGAGDVNWISDYGNCAFGAGFDNAYIGGPPWEMVDTYIEKSPFFRLEEMETPTLIMFGTEDTNVPTEQGWQHFRAMQQIGTTPVRFVLFPGATHGLSKLSHQRRKIEEELAWFDRHLFGRYEERNEAFDEKSPLALSLARAKAARSGDLFGAMIGGVLAPEVVEMEGIEIGRFEVTRAQYAEFDHEHRFPGGAGNSHGSADKFPQGTGNYPASGMTFDEATAYCEWLSERTGLRYRLITDEEMKKILARAKANLEHENNLDRWAGYSPTPDEIEMLRETIAALEESRLLIEEVGKFRPVGAGRIYDLGGNVAEWVVQSGGTGTVMGLSAVSPRDGRVPYERPPARYVGFRVCRER
jgi:dipeptidyl aminopeptidase/acylaminoacyl peptidase